MTGARADVVLTMDISVSSLETRSMKIKQTIATKIIRKAGSFNAVIIGIWPIVPVTPRPMHLGAGLSIMGLHYPQREGNHILEDVNPSSTGSLPARVYLCDILGV